MCDTEVVVEEKQKLYLNNTSVVVLFIPVYVEEKQKLYLNIVIFLPALKMS